jgi:DNA processing protein
MEYKETDLQSDFVKKLQNFEDAPKQLWQYGELPENRNRHKVVSIVGSRRCTPYGEEQAYQIAYRLAQRGVIIVSGMAYGVDAAAHRGCLDAGGITVAILGTPIDHLYPRSNEKLAHRIVENGGAIISEYPVGTETQRYHFLQRNRIVAGLADVVVITEASEHSGTITTAQQALDYGIQSFAIPGNLGSPMSAGCNRLISTTRSSIYTDISDIYIALGMYGCAHREADLGDLSPEEAKIIELLKRGVKQSETLAKNMNIKVSELTQFLVMLEIKGLVISRPKGEWLLL